MTAEPAVRVVLGAKWLDIVPIVQMLALNTFLVICTANSHSALYALGRPDLWVRAIGAGALVIVPLLYIGIEAAGLVGAAVAVTAATGASLPVAAFYVRRLLDVRAGMIVRAVWRSIAATLVMAGALLVIRGGWAPSTEFGTALAQLLVLVAAGAGTYVAAHFVLWHWSGCPDGPERQTSELLARKLPRTGPLSFARTWLMR